MKWMEKYTEDEMIQRIWAVEEVKKLISRRSYYIANGLRKEELDELWVNAPELRATASFGGNWGFYVGMKEIERWYVSECMDRLRREGENGEEFMTGYSSFRPVTTPLVKVAGDRRTARGLFYSIGEESWNTREGAKGYWFNEKIAVDCVNENGSWHIWHMVIANDFTTPCGRALSSIELYPEEKDNISRSLFGTPTIAMTVHDARFNWCDNYPAMPEDYESFDILKSYAPEGHPMFTERKGRWR